MNTKNISVKSLFLYKIVFLLNFFFLGIMSKILAQDFLNDYFKGNKDSLRKEALKLIQLPEPIFKPTKQFKMPTSQELSDMGFEQVSKPENRYFLTRDNKKIFAYLFSKKSKNTIILVHGVASGAFMYNKTATLLQEATNADVYAVDLRGHGQSEGKKGDVDYINQYEDDLVDIIKTIRKEKPKGKIIIAGHSMGGGIALKYATQKKYPKVDGFLFFAPLIGHNSPAISQKNEEKTEDEFMKIHITRLIGLKMLNQINEHQADSLPVLFFNLPKSIPLRHYSFRANASMAPDDYKSALKAIKSNSLVLIGSKDEAFDSQILQKAFLENSKANVHIVESATHNGIRHNSQSFIFIKKWFEKL